MIVKGPKVVDHPTSSPATFIHLSENSRRMAPGMEFSCTQIVTGRDDLRSEVLEKFTQGGGRMDRASGGRDVTNVPIGARKGLSNSKAPATYMTLFESADVQRACCIDFPSPLKKPFGPSLGDAGARTQTRPTGTLSLPLSQIKTAG